MSIVNDILETKSSCQLGNHLGDNLLPGQLAFSPRRVRCDCALPKTRLRCSLVALASSPLTRPPLIKLRQFQRTRFLIQLLPEAVQEKASGPADILAVAHHARVALLTSSTSSFLCRLDPHLSPVTHVGGSAFTVRARSSLLLWDLVSARKLNIHLARPSISASRSLGFP